MKLIVALVLFVACRPLPQAADPDADIIETIGVCAKACANLRAIHCPEGDPSPDGASCESVCQTARAYVDPVCAAKAASTDAARLCNLRCAR